MLPYQSGTVRVSSPFGERVLNGANQIHYGIDLVGTDKTIVSPVDGIVVQSRIVEDPNNRTSEWGEYICIQGKDGNYYYFCHLSKRKVVIYQSVKAGDVIGVEGNTGYSFGSHLHFEVRSGSATGTSVNPCPFIGIVNASGTTYDVNNKTGKQSEEEDEVTENEAKKIADQNDASDYAVEPVIWAMTNDILFGDGNGNLQLKSPCTREQMITFIYRLNQLWESKLK